jgi:hypothetical protein
MRDLLRFKRGQQEMVGFVLIVVLVVIALVIFLVISARKPQTESQNSGIENMLEVIMKYTTDCAPVFEPQYDNMQDLIKSCYDNERCSNLNKMGCDYLNETLKNVLDAVISSESGVSAYQLDIFSRDDLNQTTEILPSLKQGACKGSVSGAQREISAGYNEIIVKLQLCNN